MSRISNILNSQKGISLYLSILMMSIVLVLALGISSILTGQLKIAREMKNSIKAFYAAESGIEHLSYEDSVVSQPVGTVISDIVGPAGSASYVAAVAGCGVFQSVGESRGAKRAIEKRIYFSKMVFAASVDSGNLGGVEGADNICQTKAETAGLAGNYKAWITGEDSDTSPEGRFSHSDVHYKRTDCLTVADNWADLTDGDLQNNISLDENGVPRDGVVFTNTDTDGSQTASGGGVTCDNWTSTGGNAKSGETLETDSDWTQSGIDRSCNSSSYIYCFEQ